MNVKEVSAWFCWCFGFVYIQGQDVLGILIFNDGMLNIVFYDDMNIEVTHILYVSLS